MLKAPAGNVALAAAIVARSVSEEIDPFASMMLEGYLTRDQASPGRKKRSRRGAGE